MNPLVRSCKSLVNGIKFLGSFQCNLIYLPNYPEGSRQYVRVYDYEIWFHDLTFICYIKVPKPSERGLPYFEEILTTEDNVKIRIYVLQQGDDKTAQTRPTILLCHVRIQ